MKNTLNIRREFGEVIIRAFLPSVEDFCKKMSVGVCPIDDIIGPDMRREIYGDLNECYQLPGNIAGDLNNVRRGNGSDPDYMQLNFGLDRQGLIQSGAMNAGFLTVKGYAKERSFKYTGIYSEQVLAKYKKNLEDVVKYIINFRRPLSFAFEVEEADENAAAATIRL